MPKDLNLTRNNFRKQILPFPLFYTALKCLLFRLLLLSKNTTKYTLGARVRSNPLAKKSRHNTEPPGAETERLWLNKEKLMMPAWFSFSHHCHSAIVQGKSYAFAEYRVWGENNLLQIQGAKVHVHSLCLPNQFKKFLPSLSSFAWLQSPLQFNTVSVSFVLINIELVLNLSAGRG